MRQFTIPAAALALALPTVAHAEDCAGVATRHYEPAIAVHEVKDGPTTYFIRSTGATTQTMPSEATASRWQHCVGFHVASPDGRSQGIGNCYMVDADGDVEVMAWTTGDGEAAWETVGGTGKHADGARNAGTFAEIARFGDGMRFNQWTGTCAE